MAVTHTGGEDMDLIRHETSKRIRPRGGWSTNSNSGFILQLYKKVLQVPGYEMLLKKEIRTSLQGLKTREQTIY
nr:hypothetical protein [uncultured Macellibacteroides sp.]